MFDTAVVKRSSNNNYNTFNNHSANGLLCKSMVKSKIVRFDKDSEYEETMFSNEPYINKRITETGFYGSYTTKKEVKIIVLQVLLVNDTRFIVEYITEDDFNEELGLKDCKE